MSKARLHATLGGSTDDIEAAFYEALRQGDLERLMACWADEEDILCVQPGGGRLLGHEAIRESFAALFQRGGAIHVQAQALRKVESLTSSMHSVVEQIEVATPEGPRVALVIATNVYQRTAQGWRMVAHHASPGTEADVPIESGSRTIHHLH